MPIRRQIRTVAPGVDTAERQQALAEALYTKSLRGNVPATGGPVQATYGAGAGLVDLANTLASAWGMKNANNRLDGARQADTAARADALSAYTKSTPDNQVGAQALENLKATAPDDLPEVVTPRSEAMTNMASTFGNDAQGALALALMQRDLPPKPERVDTEYTLSPGQARFRDGQQIAAVPGAPAGQSSAPGEIEIARELSDPNTPEARKKELRSILAMKYPQAPAQEPLVAIQTPDGRSVYVPRSQAAGATPAATRENFVPGEGERTAANYFGRMQAAEGLLGDYKPSTMDYIAADRMMKGGPVSGSMANLALSAEGQKYYQAASDWVRAKLRKESGAVISPEEMAQEIKQYFPLPNDGPQTIEQKKRSREQAMSGMRDMSGRAVSSPAQAPSQADPLGIR